MLLAKRELARLQAEIENLSQMHDAAMRLLREAEIRAAKAETLAEARQCEIERLERAFGSIPPAGGFINRLEAEEPDAEPDETEEQSGFSERMAEVFGGGLTLEEIERRQAEYRSREVQRLRDELEELHAEQRDTARLASAT